MNEFNIVVETRPVSGYTKYHYALLRGHGIRQLFDTLRYENAFFCRRADVELLKHRMAEGERKAFTEPIEVMICQIGSGRKPNWTYGRLLTSQQLKELPLEDVIRGEADFTQSKPTSRIRAINEVEVTGTLVDVLEAMFINNACPAEESGAHVIESAPHQLLEPITVKLKTFSAVPGGWRVPTGKTGFWDGPK